MGNESPARDEMADHVDRWLRDTAHLSSTSAVRRHPSYRMLVASGERAVSPLVERLRARPSVGPMLALAEIVGAGSPEMPEGKRGRILAMARIWTDWQDARTARPNL